jgi:DNA-directed RNA polymerase subunit RPC12/RpoP
VVGGGLDHGLITRARNDVTIVSVLLALVLAFLGVVFIAGSQGVVLRIVVGGVLLAAAVALAVASRLRPKVEQRNIVQKIDVSGKVRLAELECSRCGAQLDDKAMEVKAGAVFVSCPYCKARYQLEEEPKW